MAVENFLSINGGLNRDITYKWSIFHCHVWLHGNTIMFFPSPKPPQTPLACRTSRCVALSKFKKIEVSGSPVMRKSLSDDKNKIEATNLNASHVKHCRETRHMNSFVHFSPATIPTRCRPRNTHEYAKGWRAKCGMWNATEEGRA